MDRESGVTGYSYQQEIQMNLANKGLTYCWSYTYLNLPSENQNNTVIGYIRAFHSPDISSLTDVIKKYCVERKLHLAKIFYETKPNVYKEAPILNAMVHFVKSTEYQINHIIFTSDKKLVNKSDEFVKLVNEVSLDISIITIN